MAFPTQKNFLSLHGRRFGLFQGLLPGFLQGNDCWVGGDAFQGVLKGVASGLTTVTAQSSQALGFQLGAAINQFTTVASGSVAVLPPAVTGMEIWVDNDAGANGLTVCGSATTSDTIDAVATATGVTVSAARRTLFKALNTASVAEGTQAAVVGLWTSAGCAKST